MLRILACEDEYECEVMWSYAFVPLTPAFDCCKLPYDVMFSNLSMQPAIEIAWAILQR